MITVVDENDNSPQFLDPSYMGSVIEEDDGATVIVVGIKVYQSTRFVYLINIASTYLILFVQ